MKRFIIPVVVASFLIAGCNPCLLSQIPVQYYFSDSANCEFYLPDYSNVVQVTDNCGFVQFTQDPPSGLKLQGGTDITVSLFATDAAGNQSSMRFEVVVIDEIPPKFIIDPQLLSPTGMYQDSIRTWHFYTFVEDTATTAYQKAKMQHYHSDKPLTYR